MPPSVSISYQQAFDRQVTALVWAVWHRKALGKGISQSTCDCVFKDWCEGKTDLLLRAKDYVDLERKEPHGLPEESDRTSASNNSSDS